MLEKIILLFSLILFNCMGSQNQSMKLHNNVLFFHERLKSGEIEKAQKYIVNRNTDEFLKVYKNKTSILTDYEIQNLMIDEKGETAIVNLCLWNRKNDSITIEKVNIIEFWQLKNGIWILSDIRK